VTLWIVAGCVYFDEALVLDLWTTTGIRHRSPYTATSVSAERGEFTQSLGGGPTKASEGLLACSGRTIAFCCRALPKDAASERSEQ
jgi:hypothetical protein